MKKIIAIIIIIAVSLSLSCISCIAQGIKGSGKLTTQSIAISNFSKIKIETYVEINYSQTQNTGSLEFTVDNNLLEYYVISTKDDVLYISLKDQTQPRPWWINPTKSVITVSSEQLEEIVISGNSKINFCTAYNSKILSIKKSGSGKVIANRYPVKIEDCNIKMSGSGMTQLAGTIQQANIEISGSGKVKALDCEINQLHAKISGSGSVDACVKDKLVVRISGSGKMNFKGNPLISKSISGSGKIKKL